MKEVLVHMLESTRKCATTKERVLTVSVCVTPATAERHVTSLTALETRSVEVGLHNIVSLSLWKIYICNNESQHYMAY